MRPGRVTPATERVTLYCTWRPSALTTRPRKQVRRWVSLSANFRGHGGRPSPTNDFWRQKTSPWAITWRCLRDTTFSRFDTLPACERQTDIRTDT